MAGEIAGEGIEAEHHILDLAVASGHMQLGEQGAVGHDLRRDTVLVYHGVDIDRIAFGRFSERRPGELGGRHRTRSQQEDAGNEAEDPNESHGYAPG